MPSDIRDFGAQPGDKLSTKAIQAAIDTLAPSGGTVVVPPGNWFTGTLWLRSGVHLHLESGARVLGTNNPAHYPRWSPIEEGVVVSRRVGPRRLIGAVNCHDISITGPGMIDGNGGCGGQLADPEGNEAHPQNVQLVNCRNVLMRDVSLRNAGSWNQLVLGCEQVLLSGLNVWNHGNPTNDGLDIDGSRDVRISDLDIDSHDDALVFKSTGPLPCRNIVVSNCRLRSHCHGIKFGTESVGGFEHVLISNCSVGPSRKPAPLPDFPEGRPVITGCALECVDGGTMRHISIDGLQVERVFSPVFLKLGNRMDRRIEEKTTPVASVMEDISITRVHAREAGPVSCSVTGYPGHPIRRVRLAMIDMELMGGVTPGQVLDAVPENSHGYPEVNMFGREHGRRHLPTYGFFLRHVEDIRLDEIHLRLRNPDCREALLSEQVRNLEMTSFTIDGKEWEKHPGIAGPFR